MNSVLNQDGCRVGRATFYQNKFLESGISLIGVVFSELVSILQQSTGACIFIRLAKSLHLSKNQGKRQRAYCINFFIVVSVAGKSLVSSCCCAAAAAAAYCPYLLWC